MNIRKEIIKTVIDFIKIEWSPFIKVVTSF